MRILVFALAATVTPIADRAGGQTVASGRFADLAREIEARRARDSVPAVSVAVIKDGTLVWSAAFGVANLERREPATTSTRFPIGSVSKAFTSTALMTLVQAGRLKLDERPNRFLGASPIVTRVGDSSAVTLRSLASHTSGIARHDLFSYEDEKVPPISIEERIRRYAVVSRLPATTYEYSNLNYMVLAHIIARTSGRPFGDYLNSAVLVPLRLLRTTLGPPDPRVATVAVSYDEARRAVPVREEPFAGAGGLFSTAEDLARFGQFHLGSVPPGASAPLSSDLLAELHRPVVQSAIGEWYALGWRVNRSSFADDMIYHTGSNGASASVLILIPERGLCVVALSNVVSDLPGWIATQVVNAYGVGRRASAGDPVDSTGRFTASPLRATPSWVGTWMGSIETDGGAIPMQLTIDDSARMTVQLRDATPASAAGVRAEGDFVRGSFDGNIAPAETMGRRYRLHLKLSRVDDALVGTVTAVSVPRERVITLSYLVRLQRP